MGGKESKGLATGEDFTTRLMNDMDPALLDFVKFKVNTFVKWDLIRFFHENPHTMDTAENIARYIGRHANAVRPELDDLVENGVMSRRKIDETWIYALSADDEVRASVEGFILACEDRHFRVKAVYHIIKSMR